MSTKKKTTPAKAKRKPATTKKAKTTTSSAKPAEPSVIEKPPAKPKAKKDNIMRKIFISKVVVNMSLGTGGEPLAKAKTILENLTGQKPVDILAKRTNRDFGLRKGEPMGCKVTLRGELAKDFVKRALDVIDFRIPVRAVDQAGNVSFGISEHIQIPGVKYDPNLGIFGMDVCICTERPGFRINRRRRARHKVPRRHRITPDEAMNVLSSELGIQFTTPEMEEEF
ncbi:MAG: 50S ribosomal protein L5 [Promethearchaeota archaeon]